MNRTVTTKIDNVLIQLDPPHFRGERWVVMVSEREDWSDKVRIRHSNSFHDPEQALLEYFEHIRSAMWHEEQRNTR